MKRVLILLGGMWHDFDGFSNSLQPVLEAAGWQVEATYDLERLTGLEHEDLDLVLSYTCFAKHGEGLENSGPEKMSEAQIDGLAAWVRKGGALLAAHSATVLGYPPAGVEQA
jgi:type 1 glutamine amidotransferase